MEKSLIEGAKEVEESLHRLPCKIVYDGKAPVNTYFIPTTIEGTLSSTFRGRGLIGRKEAVPMKYSGKILVDRESQLACNSTFDQLTLWEHGEAPTVGSDSALRVMSWLQVAEDLHAHIDI